jgi:hypothetical protein
MKQLEMGPNRAAGNSKILWLRSEEVLFGKNDAEWDLYCNVTHHFFSPLSAFAVEEANPL